MKSSAQTAKKRGRLVLFNGTVYGTPLERHLYQVMTGTIFPLLHRFSPKLEKPDSKVEVDYWATISAPWASGKVIITISPKESKKNK